MMTSDRSSLYRLVEELLCPKDDDGDGTSKSTTETDQRQPPVIFPIEIRPWLYLSDLQGIERLVSQSESESESQSESQSESTSDSGDNGDNGDDNGNDNGNGTSTSTSTKEEQSTTTTTSTSTRPHLHSHPQPLPQGITHIMTLNAMSPPSKALDFSYRIQSAGYDHTYIPTYDQIGYPLLEKHWENECRPILQDVHDQYYEWYESSTYRNDNNNKNKNNTIVGSNSSVHSGDHTDHSHITQADDDDTQDNSNNGGRSSLSRSSSSSLLPPQPQPPPSSQPQKIVVHCANGQNRSGLIVACALIAIDCDIHNNNNRSYSSSRLQQRSSTSSTTMSP